MALFCFVVSTHPIRVLTVFIIIYRAFDGKPQNRLLFIKNDSILIIEPDIFLFLEESLKFFILIQRLKFAFIRQEFSGMMLKL